MFRLLNLLFLQFATRSGALVVAHAADTAAAKRLKDAKWLEFLQIWKYKVESVISLRQSTRLRRPCGLPSLPCRPNVRAEPDYRQRPSEKWPCISNGGIYYCFKRLFHIKMNLESSFVFVYFNFATIGPGDVSLFIQLKFDDHFVRTWIIISKW